MIQSNDTARCRGVGYALDDGTIDLRDGCERCLRRLAPAGERASWIEPPPVIAFECEFLLEAYVAKERTCRA